MKRLPRLQEMDGIELCLGERYALMVWSALR